MAFLVNSQAKGESGKNEQFTQTPWRGTTEARGPMQLHRFKAGPGCDLSQAMYFKLFLFFVRKHADLH